MIGQKTTTSFNDEQLKAIKHFTGPAMIIAGPGSGKTTVITNRILHLIDTENVPASDILVITFTASAAEEMKARYIKLAKERLQLVEEQTYLFSKTASTSTCSHRKTQNYTNVTFGTFHSIFLSILKEFSDFREYQLAGKSESIPILKKVILHLYPGNTFTSDYFSYLLFEISKVKNGMHSSIPKINEITKEYTSLMHQNGYMDYDDMVLNCLELLRNEPLVLHTVREKYPFIMIDEFQDINPVQFRTVQLLAAPHNNIFVVGDDDQSIYAFRGSDPSIMLDFKKYYPDCNYIHLFTNYRSHQNIVQNASDLIRHNHNRYAKQLSAFHKEKGQIIYHQFFDAEAEANYIYDSICEYGSDYKTIGILYRTHRTGNAIRRLIEQKTFAEKEISLMTFHASKGLEFDIVYIISADDGVTPSARNLNDPAALEEERRLFYVAMTRAKKILHISNTKYYYNRQYKISRFLKECLPLSCLIRSKYECIQRSKGSDRR